MPRRLAVLLLVISISAAAQSLCPSVNFLAARTANLKPSPTSHVDVVRQGDGSYTGFEVTDAAPYRAIRTTPHFEQQFAACLPHTLPASPSGVPAANPVGAGSQLQVSAPIGANFFAAHISDDQLTIYFDVFDAQHNLLSEKPFTSVVSPPGYVGSANERFQSLALADLNNDGKLDFIAVLDTPLAQSIAYGGVWTFLGDGDGTFQTGDRQVLTSRALLMAAQSVAIADLNGDGKADLVLAAPEMGAVNVFLGNGDGSFNTQPLAVAMPTAMQSWVSIAVADWNGDGKPDLIAAPCFQGSYPAVAVALANGNGSFQPAVTYAALLPSASATPAAIAMVAAGDLNGDGIPDIVTAGGTILFGDGKGGVASRIDYPSSAALSVAIGDFDGDGKTDVLFGNGNPVYFSGNTTYSSLTVLFGEGGGALASAPLSGGPISSSGFAYSGPRPPPPGAAILPADFNGDGITDMALVTFTVDSSNTGSVQITVLAGRGNGQFSSGNTQTFPHAANFLMESAVAADFNHDGKPDIAVLLWNGPSGGEAQIYLGKSDGTFAAPLSVAAPSDPGVSISAPDFNSDGIPDLVMTTENTAVVLQGKGDGTFGPPISFNGESVAFGDFNGDGKLDLATIGETSTSVSVMLGRGDGTFFSPIMSPLPAQVGGYPISIAAADFDGDGRLDVAVPTLAGVVVLSGKGDGTFSGSHTSSGATTGFAALDLNGDKIPDLVGYGAPGLATNSGPLSVRLGNGDGTFQPATVILAQLSNVTSPVFAAADLNRDGSPDIAVLYQGIGVSALLNLSQPAAPLVVVSAATFAAGFLASNSVASAFGEGILPAGQSASGSQPLPAELAGITVTVKDSAGASRAAPLYFVSPNQINFVVPAATAVGPATVTVNGAASGKPLSAQANVARVAPMLFTVGSNIAAAYAVAVAPTGMQTVVPVFTQQAGSVATNPIDLTTPGAVYLTLFGTGFDAASTGSVSATVQGVIVPVSYAGTQQSYAGLDQVNLLLAPSLTGTGDASVVVSVNGQTSNPVLISIR